MMVGVKSEEGQSRPGLIVRKGFERYRWTSDIWIWTIEKGMASIASIILVASVANQ